MTMHLDGDFHVVYEYAPARTIRVFMHDEAGAGAYGRTSTSLVLVHVHDEPTRLEMRGKTGGRTDE